MKISNKNALKWSAIERLIAQLLQFLVMLYLGRNLGPEAFGILSITMLFVSISQVFVDGGFSNALIQKKNLTNDDISTVYIYNMLIALLIYMLVYILSPLISEVFFNQDLSHYIRVVMLCVIISSFSIVQRTLFTIDMDFKAIAVASLSSIIISSIIAIILVKLGFGVWSLIYQTLSFNILNTIILNVLKPWKIKIKFSFKSFKSMAPFSFNLLLSNVFEVCFSNIYVFLIGKFISITDVGQFNQAKMISSLPSMTLTRIILRTLFPAMSQYQDNKEQLLLMYTNAIKLTSIIIFPVMILISLLSKDLVTYALGEKWLSIYPLIIILCIGYAFYPIHAINLNLLQVRKKSGVFLLLEVIKKAISIIILFSVFDYGVEFICWGITLQLILELVINSFFTRKMIDIKIIEQVQLYFKPMLLNVISLIFSVYVHYMFNVNYIFMSLIFIVLYTIFIYLFERFYFKMIFSF